MFWKNIKKQIGELGVTTKITADCCKSPVFDLGSHQRDAHSKTEPPDRLFTISYSSRECQITVSLPAASNPLPKYCHWSQSCACNRASLSHPSSLMSHKLHSFVWCLGYRAFMGSLSSCNIVLRPINCPHNFLSAVRVMDSSCASTAPVNRVCLAYSTLQHLSVLIKLQICWTESAVRQITL